VKQVDFEESCKEYKDDDIDGLKIRISVEWFTKHWQLIKLEDTKSG
jgi:hypothetical protein